MAAATIAVVVAATAALIWWTSDARATISRPAAVPAPSPTPAREVPATLNQLWTAKSPATNAPVVVGGTVATGDGRQVDGRDPGTGQSRWSYARDSDLCGLSWVYHYAVAVYQGRPRLRAGQHPRRVHGPSRARPQQLRRPARAPVLRRHDGVVGRRHPAGTVALGHGPDAGLRRDRRPGETVGAGTALRMPAGLGGGQLVGGIGAGELRESGRPAACPIAPGQGRRRTPATRRGRARDRAPIRALAC